MIIKARFFCEEVANCANMRLSPDKKGYTEAPKVAEKVSLVPVFGALNKKPESGEVYVNPQPFHFYINDPSGFGAFVAGGVYTITIEKDDMVTFT